MIDRTIRVYVAGPYTVGDPKQNVLTAMNMGSRLWDSGYIPFVPHLFHHWDQHHQRSYGEWMLMGRFWLESCNVLLRLPGPSNGADEEADYMGKILYRPCYQSFDELLTKCPPNLSLAPITIPVHLPKFDALL